MLQVSAVLGPIKEALLHLSQYRCLEALQALKGLPPAQVCLAWPAPEQSSHLACLTRLTHRHIAPLPALALQYNTSWVMALVGRCAFEMVDYPKAARAYEAMRTMDPLRVEVGGAKRSTPPR